MCYEVVGVMIDLFLKCVMMVGVEMVFIYYFELGMLCDGVMFVVLFFVLN